MKRILIVLRGNSGSGKTTTARALEKMLGCPCLLISQDEIRRNMLSESDGPDTLTQSLIRELILFGWKNGRIVILEGILASRYYSSLFSWIREQDPEILSAWYFDLPFEECLHRHQTRKESLEFGVEKLQSWWREDDRIADLHEQRIPCDWSLEQQCDRILESIQSDTGFLPEPFQKQAGG